MKLLLFSSSVLVLISFLACFHSSGVSATSLVDRNLHALWHLWNMIDCTTNDSYIEAIWDYAMYGCYCGFGGKGDPLDGVDTCCMTHDLCYDVGSYYCPFYPLVYLVHYQYDLNDCETDHPSISCKPVSEYPWWYPLAHCAEALCKCDAAAAICFGKNEYHPKYRFYNKFSRCHGIPSQ